jgi:hypothetical protein
MSLPGKWWSRPVVPETSVPITTPNPSPSSTYSGSSSCSPSCSPPYISWCDLFSIKPPTVAPAPAPGSVGLRTTRGHHPILPRLDLSEYSLNRRGRANTYPFPGVMPSSPHNSKIPPPPLPSPPVLDDLPVHGISVSGDRLSHLSDDSRVWVVNPPTPTQASRRSTVPYANTENFPYVYSSGNPRECVFYSYHIQQVKIDFLYQVMDDILHLRRLTPLQIRYLDRLPEADLRDLIQESDGKLVAYFERYPESVCKMRELCKKESTHVDSGVSSDTLRRMPAGSEPTLDILASATILASTDTNAYISSHHASWSHRNNPPNDV